MTSKIKVSVESVSPQYAQTLLDTHNTDNYRKLNINTVRQYADIMRKGDWLTEACTIVIDYNGILTNGQHRLHAVLKAGTAIDMIIVRNADPRSRYVIDDHMPRRMKDHVGCAPYHITMVNVFLRSEGLHNSNAYKKNVDFYKRHVYGTMGDLVSEFHNHFSRTDSPFTSYGIRAALILAVLNKEISKKKAVSLFKQLCTFRKYKSKNGVLLQAYTSSTRTAVQATMPSLLSKLVDLLDADMLPTYTGVGSRWVNHQYSTSREKASKLMFATYQAICKETRNDTKFSGALSSQVCKALGI